MVPRDTDQPSYGRPPQAEPELEEGWNPEENSLAAPQPEHDAGVDKDMATVAINASRIENAALSKSVQPHSAVAWEQLTDAEIMLRVREGEDAGFGILIEKYRRPIVHFMFRMVHNQAIAEELAQEVFLRVYRSRQTYRAEARFSTWLYRIATNLGVNHARDTKHERMAQNVYLDQPDPETGTTPDVADGTLTVEQEMLKQERFKAIREHVLSLPERQRTAVLMHKYQGMDYKQIGEVLRLSESATKSLLFRAYQELRQKLKDFV
ncbi:MAG TPA: RNA polymerase sigma factor [Acidobacteriaceae bacterium]|jgi:RNA polymerase sigma-70 factor (ECF subfamily)|nr:RNA polymerase sigma factor [Acidobacteriaceae bacterium]